MHDTLTSDNAYGVVIDGDGGTSGVLDGIQVLGNIERGMWVQNLAGSAAEPALTVSGGLFEDNRFTGMGFLASAGVVISDAMVRGTIAAPIVTSLGSTEDVGDGLGLFEGATDFTITGVVFENNARAQALIDAGGSGISFSGGSLTEGGGEYKVVIQNTTETVSLPSDYESVVTDELGISAPTVTVGGGL